MLIFVACVSGAIAALVMLTKKDSRDPEDDSKLVLAIKTFVFSFIIIYFALMFFPPTIDTLTKGQIIETCEPDF